MSAGNPRFLAVVLTAMLAAPIGVSALGGGEPPADSAPPADTGPLAPAAAPQSATAGDGSFSGAIAAVAEAQRACVLHIDITGKAVQQAPQFGPFGFAPAAPGTNIVPVRALGSGVLIDSAGHIVTNNHVVENADTITVQFLDGSSQPARLVGRDPSTDLAIIKVDSIHGAQVARFGDSDTLRVGDWVVAIGSPRGLDWTVTAGIVSAVHRTNLGVLGPTGFEDFIQTDAAINPGNSGGPLLDLRGRVVGLNAMIISQSQGSEGLGFAIPVNLVRTIAAALIRDGKVTRGDLGLSLQDVTPAIIKGLKLPAGTRGAVVVEVIPAGPGRSAGLQQGDVIVRFGEQAITDASGLIRTAAATRPGTEVPLDLFRAGRPVSTKVTVADQYTLRQLVAASPGYELLGLKVAAVSADDARRIGLARPVGVIVTEIVPGSPADIANVAVGDFIFRVGTVDVSDPKQFAAEVAAVVPSGSALLLLRDGKTGQMGYVEVSVN